MRRSRRSPVAILSSLVLFSALVSPVAAGPTPAAEPAPDVSAALTGGQVRLTQVDDGFVQPLGVVNAGDGTGRLFVVEQRGTVRVVSGNRMQSGFFLDIRNGPAGLSTGGERGLLGLAFHPGFESNRKLFVYYTRAGGDLVIAELTANSARTSASVSTHDTLLVIEHSSQPNHNGGQLLFGPDGYLYVFTGDGGGSGDPGENAQDVNSLLGKALRIDPDLDGGYDIPSDNPYVGKAGADEIWAIGLRNPWRASFDTGANPDRLWIADVGQGSWEEVNRVDASAGGLNYGWDCREGKHSYSDPSPGISCSGLSLTGPVAEYGHGNGDCSVTGGLVYRGPIFRELVGHYVLGDFCSGRMWTIGAGGSSLQFHRNTSAMITSFGEAENGELYMTDYGDGILWRVVAPQFSDVTDSGFINDITWLGYEGITSGCGGGKYCPKGAVRRDQMASFLARALGLPPTSTDYFDDDDGNKHESNINRLAAAGITFGCGERRYCPAGIVLRDQMASFIARARNLPATGTDFYTDDNSNRHEANINRMAAAGITRGCTSTTYCPKGQTTREQMAAFLRRAFDD